MKVILTYIGEKFVENFIGYSCVSSNSKHLIFSENFDLLTILDLDLYNDSGHFSLPGYFHSGLGSFILAWAQAMAWVL